MIIIDSFSDDREVGGRGGWRNSISLRSGNAAPPRSHWPRPMPHPPVEINSFELLPPGPLAPDLKMDFYLLERGRAELRCRRCWHPFALNQRRGRNHPGRSFSVAPHPVAFNSNRQRRRRHKIRPTPAPGAWQSHPGSTNHNPHFLKPLCSGARLFE